MDQSVRRVTGRLLAAFLAVCLAVPSPAFALRNESVEGAGLEELDRTLRQIAHAVGLVPNATSPPSAAQPIPTAGMEEPLDPQVRDALLEFQAESDASRRLSAVEERLRSFQPVQRAQFLNALPWLPDQARASQLVVAAFRENRSLGEQLLNAFRAVLQEDRASGRPLFDQLSALRLLLERGSFEDTRAIREGVKAMLVDQTGRRLVSGWEDIAGEIYTLALVGSAEAAIRQYQRDVEGWRLQQGRPPQSDFYAERYLRMGENHEQLSNVYRGLVDRLSPGDAEELPGRLREEGGLEIIQKAVGQQLSSEGLSPSMRQVIGQGLPATVYEWMEKALRLRIQSTYTLILMA